MWLHLFLMSSHRDKMRFDHDTCDSARAPDALLLRNYEETQKKKHRVAPLDLLFHRDEWSGLFLKYFLFSILWREWCYQFTRSGMKLRGCKHTFSLAVV